MNFKEWFNNVKRVFAPNCEVVIMQESWAACKEEVLKIIFLNTKQNGKKSIDVDNLAKEVEKL